MEYHNEDSNQSGYDANNVEQVEQVEQVVEQKKTAARKRVTTKESKEPKEPVIVKMDSIQDKFRRLFVSNTVIEKKTFLEVIKQFVNKEGLLRNDIPSDILPVSVNDYKIHCEFFNRYCNSSSVEEKAMLKESCINNADLYKKMFKPHGTQSFTNEQGVTYTIDFDSFIGKTLEECYTMMEAAGLCSLASYDRQIVFKTRRGIEKLFAAVPIFQEKELEKVPDNFNNLPFVNQLVAELSNMTIYQPRYVSTTSDKTKESLEIIGVEIDGRDWIKRSIVGYASREKGLKSIMAAYVALFNAPINFDN